MPLGTNSDFKLAHDQADTDFEPSSIHHTVGNSPTQVAAGNHNHDLDYASLGHDHDADYAFKLEGTPVGAIIMYASSAAFPDSTWLACDGNTFSILTYPALAAIVGDRYGVHVGNNYFKPNFTSRQPQGVNLPTVPEGTIGGAATSTLVAANLPPHAHDIGHNHTAQGRNGTSAGSLTTTLANPAGTGSVVANTGINAFAGNSGNGPGTSTPVATQDPFLATVFLIKAIIN